MFLSSEITYENKELRQNLKRNHKGGFIRIFWTEKGGTTVQLQI